MVIQSVIVIQLVFFNYVLYAGANIVQFFLAQFALKTSNIEFDLILSCDGTLQDTVSVKPFMINPGVVF